VRLTTSFPDFRIVIEDVIQEENKVVVRSHITVAQTEPFMGFPATGRSLSIQAVDIHEFASGKIVRTWHTEDWEPACASLVSSTASGRGRPKPSGNGPFRRRAGPIRASRLRALGFRRIAAASCRREE